MHDSFKGRECPVAAPDLKRIYLEHLEKSLGHLRYSFEKVGALPAISEGTPEEQLESWESFAARFARTSDIFLSKLVRLLLLEKDPAYQGSMIDMINDAEKFGMINDAVVWRRIRELRNLTSHEYTVNDLSKLCLLYTSPSPRDR